MQTIITRNGLTRIPVEIRRRFDLHPGDALAWQVGGSGIRILPVSVDPIATFRGSGKGVSTARLLADRRAEAGR